MNNIDLSLPITKPISAWNKPLKADVRGLFKPLAKMIGHSVVGNWIDAGVDVTEAMTAVGLKTTPEELAWLLIHRSMQASLSNLVAENTILLSETVPTDAEKFSEQLDATLEQQEVTLGTDFFDYPAGLDILNTVRNLFRQ